MLDAQAILGWELPRITATPGFVAIAIILCLGSAILFGYHLHLNEIGNGCNVHSAVAE